MSVSTSQLNAMRLGHEGAPGFGANGVGLNHLGQASSYLKQDTIQGATWKITKI